MVALGVAFFESPCCNSHSPSSHPGVVDNSVRLTSESSALSDTRLPISGEPRVVWRIPVDEEVRVASLYHEDRYTGSADSDIFR